MTFHARIDVRNAFTAAFAVACLGLMSPVSHAADSVSGTVPAKIVRYGDLNLSTATAVQYLYQRIVSAARQVCDDRSGPRPLEEQVRTRICVKQSVERAVNAVNHPELTLLYAAKTGRTASPSAMLANRH